MEGLRCLIQCATQYHVRYRSMDMVASGATSFAGYQLSATGSSRHASGVINAKQDFRSFLRDALPTATLEGWSRDVDLAGFPAPFEPETINAWYEALEIIATEALRLSRVASTLLRFQASRGFWLLAGSGTTVKSLYSDVHLDLALVLDDGSVVPTLWGGTAGFAAGRVIEQITELNRWLQLPMRRLPESESAVSVVMGAETAGLLAHEVFGHTLEAERAEPMSRIGQVVGCEALTIADDPTLAGLRGSYEFDHEGQPARRTVLIDRGVVVGYLHDLTTAAAHGVSTTANSRCADFRFRPEVRMSVLDIAPGAHSERELHEAGALYLRGMRGAQTDGEGFRLTPALAMWLRDGEPVARIPGVVIGGACSNVRVAGVSCERKVIGGHQCIKAAPVPLGVTVLSPEFLVEGIEVDTIC